MPHSLLQGQVQAPLDPTSCMPTFQECQAKDLGSEEYSAPDECVRSKVISQVKIKKQDNTLVGPHSLSVVAGHSPTQVHSWSCITQEERQPWGVAKDAHRQRISSFSSELHSER